MTETVKVQRPIFPPDGPWLMTDHTDNRALVERLTGFTPGPWNVGPIDDTRVEDTLGNEVAQIDGDYNQPETWPVMEANARLIAAAPDLLAALTAALDQIEKAEAMRDVWKQNSQARAVALNLVAEAFGQLLPGSIKSGDHLGPEPEEIAHEIINAMHTVRDYMQSARAEALREAAAELRDYGEHQAVECILALLDAPDA